MPILTSEVRADEDIRFVIATNSDDRDDQVSETLRTGGFPVSQLFRIVRRTVPAGGKIIDLGAHVGSFSLACAAAGYDVVCVEASPANAALIELSIRENGFTNVRLMNVAISDRAGRLRFHSQGPYGHVAPDGYDGTTVDVEAVTVDEVMTRAGWQCADFVKLDIEGSEVAALRGMSRTLSQESPPVIFCESNGHMLHKFGESPQSLKAALEALGLQVYTVGTHHLVPASAQEPQGLTVVDYLAAKQVPAAMAGDVSAGTPSVADHLHDLGVSARSPILEERWYAARALRDSRAFFSGEPGAEDIRRKLVDDPVALVHQVARATQPIADLSPKPWLQRLLSRFLRT